MYRRGGFGLAAGGRAGSRGWNQWGSGRQGRAFAQPAAAGGYTYAGPCRCGFGPHAFYRNSSGGLVHSRRIWNNPACVAKNPVEQLKAEKEELERRLAELNEKIKE
jgi:hypothetical protein